MKSLRVGLLIISGEWGGAEETVYQLAQHLIKLHVGVSLFINDELKDYCAGIRGVPVYTLGAFSDRNKYDFLYKLFKIRRNLIKVLKREPLDLIHIQLEGSLLVYIGLFSKFDIPVVFTLQGSEIRDFFGNKSLYQISVRFALQKMFEKSRAMTSPSFWQVKKFEREFKSKIIIISHGVNTEEFRPIRVREEKKVIFFVGRFVEIKGVRELVAVARELPEYEFWFAGWGPLARLMTLPNTKNLGFKNRSELLDLYNKATICVFPSYYEPFGIVGLEAMACGRPVIATRKGFSEFLENDKEGLIIEPRSPKRLKESVVKLMKDSRLRKRLGRDARKKALKYDWREIVKKYYFLYKRVLVK